MNISDGFLVRGQLVPMLIATSQLDLVLTFIQTW
jgi:hypothetical protein